MRGTRFDTAEGYYGRFMLFPSIKVHYTKFYNFYIKMFRSQRQQRNLGFSIFTLFFYLKLIQSTDSSGDYFHGG